MAPRLGRTGPRRPWQSVHALLVLPIALIVVITVVDLRLPWHIHLGPTLVIAPALTPSFAGPRATAAIGALAVAAQILIGVHRGGVGTTNHIVQIITLAVLVVLTVLYSALRERRQAQLAQVRTVAEAAQHVLMWPLPEQIGPLRIASLYLAAEDEAQIGGDLYAATLSDGAVRLLIGDVRGKGLPAIGEAALLLGSFRESAHRRIPLAELASRLDQSVTRHAADLETPGEEGERFATALLVEIPDRDPVTRMTSCGHPPPLLLSPGHAVTVPSLHPSPPLGVHGGAEHTLDVFSFEPGDTLLLYTDGVVEARDERGRFYPLAERVARWTEDSPEALMHHLRRDLLAHAGGRLGDDAALIAVQRTAVERRRHHGRGDPARHG
ncbi:MULTISPECIES: PP2C family protein-serine/threonine phosphatase [Streptomyces]|uniref:PP2C family protein-serine/threonine phosphatase n=1 Tax=Streptomyces bangladeshensis TaxID=295352 RepID=A0ABN3C498_9ACTN|nr:PP2C family protein-serine/threonine phosphatase [Streptomyces sp. FBKL.4005]MYU26928.1 SpoIIE family protein phosphatase [Streptomyces sp. SID7810]OYP13547.1 serine/threonine-protein phosphatase [Streptomyces sp. FBKL.4005]CUW25760.1 Phosphoserine phosphatase RsbP [Streptomyces reticuli]